MTQGATLARRNPLRGLSRLVFIILGLGTVTVIPVAIFAFIGQKHIISGITGGAISAE
jgi:hypothetical protein